MNEEKIKNWLYEHREDGVTIVGYKVGKPVQYGRNLVEVILKIAEVIESEEKRYEFLNWVKETFDNIIYTAPELMYKEWIRVDQKLRELDPEETSLVWKIWSI